MVDFTQDTVSEVTFNEAGADVDFRIESADDSKAVFIDASKNTIQLGTAATTHITASGNISGSASGYIRIYQVLHSQMLTLHTSKQQMFTEQF